MEMELSDNEDDEARALKKNNKQRIITDYKQEDTIFPLWLYEYLYPPNTPRECQMLRLENIAVPACYLLVGIMQGLQGPFTNVYPLDIGASAAQQVTISSIRSIPSSFKILFGFISDNFTLMGYRRKSYMLLGWLMASASMSTLLYFSNLELPQREVPDDAPTVPFLAFTTLAFGIGFWFADVMGDSIVAEKAKLEVQKGEIQSMCYACRFFGLMTSAPLSTYLYTFVGPWSIIQLMVLLPLLMLPPLWYLAEERNAPVKSTKDQCNEIWNTVCSRAVWQPMGFVYVYHMLQVSNGAWKNFQKVVLGLTSAQLNVLLNVAYVLLYLGVLAYKNFFINWSWRTVYIITTLLNGIFSVLQVLLIYGITFGLSNFWFSFGDDVFSEFISGIQFLPTTIMMVHLCPAGSEGASYAMFTTVSNSAMNLTQAISTQLLRIWDVTSETMKTGDKTGITNLTLLTTGLQTSALLFIGLLPRTKDDLMKLGEKSGKSAKGGAIFLVITFGSILYALSISLRNITNVT